MRVNAEELWRQAVRERKERWVRRALRRARFRAKARGLVFSLEAEHIQTPDLCPVSLTALNYYNSKRASDSPCLERRDPGLGWIVGNVITISYWVSCLKSGRSWEEFEGEAERILSEALRSWLREQARESDPLARLRREINDEFG